jgi:hypothetical protein
MPKHKPEYEYVTSNQISGMTWREIAEIVKEETGTGSTAGVRHIFYQAMKKIAKPIASHLGVPPTEDNINRIVKSEEFQMWIRDAMIDEIYTEEDNV